MGQVYLGRSPGGRLVAIKVVRDEIVDHPEALSRFRREVGTAREVRSAYVANLVDASLDRPPYWLATEYADGPTLAHAVRERQAFPAAICRGVFAALAEGLATVHAFNVTHRDLKPQNIILSGRGPLLIDFGIARGAGDTALTATGLAPGTPGFTAPEVLMSNQVGPEADIFALGATMAYTATGRAPFGGGQPAAIGYRTVHEQIDLAGVEPGLAGLIGGCVAKDPAARPSLVEILARCAVRTPLVEGPFYRALAELGTTVPPLLTPPVEPFPGPYGLPTVTSPARLALASGYTPTELVAPAPTRRGRPWLVAGAVGLALAVGSVVAVQLVPDKGDTASHPPSPKVSNKSRPATPPVAETPGGTPQYIDMNKISRDFWGHTTPGGKCNLPAEERVMDGFMTSVGEGTGDPAKRILRGKVRIGWRNEYPTAHTPYYVSVSVKPPHEIDSDTGKPIAGLTQQNLSPGYASKPVDINTGNASDWHYLTYPDDFTSHFENHTSPAIAITNDPGDWTVLFQHVETPHEYASVMCSGFQAK